MEGMAGMMSEPGWCRPQNAQTFGTAKPGVSRDRPIPAESIRRIRIAKTGAASHL
jgi:hypothetical protein